MITTQPTHRYEAYLGPNLPETIARGISHKSGAEWAVVLQDHQSGKTRLVSVYHDRGIAERLAKALTTKRRFGILCYAREATR